MAELSTTEFDYSKLDEDTSGKLRYYATTGRALIRRSIEDIAKMGEVLSEARGVLASHNKNEGTFVKWAAAEFDISSKTIYNYVNAWERMLCNGYTTYRNFSPTAVYLLANEERAKPILKKVERLAAADAPVTKADIKRLLAPPKKKKKVDEPDATDTEDEDEIDDEDEAELDEEETIEEFPEDETLEEICQRETAAIESWARQIAQLMKDAQKALQGVPTLDELNARDGWERKLKEALSTLRGTKPVLCPICQGDGDATCPCIGNGRVTKQQHGQMV